MPGLFTLICLALAMSPLRARAEADSEWLDLPADLPHNYGVIGVVVEAASPETLRVSRVHPHSPAKVAHLRPGDLILAVDGYRVRTQGEFSDYAKSRKPDTVVRLNLLRGDPAVAVTINCGVTDRARLYFLMAEQGRAPVTDTPRHLAWTAGADSLERAARRLIAGQGAEGVLDSLVTAFDLEAERYAADCRLADIDYLLRHPLKTTAVAHDLAADLTAAPDLADLLSTAAAHLDLEAIQADDDAQLTIHHPVPSRLEQLVLEPLVQAGRLVERAMAGLDSSEQVYLRSHALSLLQRFGRTFYLDRGDSAETEAHVRTLRLAKEVDVASLVAAARTLAPFASRQGRRDLKSMGRRLDRASLPADLPTAFAGDFVFAARTDWGWVLVGDEGDNYYGEDALFILDLGGDDLYANNAASPALVASRSIYASSHGFSPPATLRCAAPVGVVLDLGGNDRYIGHRTGSVGSALGGVGLLVDASGNDLYEGSDLSQAAAFCGIGILVDERGDDVYLARESSQAAAYFGVGLLLDRRGDDLYSATQFGQGFGGTRGLGLLLDREGADQYLADRAVPSGYGTPGVYNGWSQGVGCGFRGYTSGGLGLLVDEAGNDRYQAGNFSQGVGYFFGLGALLDHGGDDEYRGTRYTQGASAHQAAGVLIDGAGDDRYTGRVAANQGGAWDVGIALLEDRGGDDEYLADGLAQGAAAMNGLGILMDWGGSDRYKAGLGQGDGGSTEYWGGRNAANLGLLIDVGAASDTYSLKERVDGTTRRTTNVGLFRDE